MFARSLLAAVLLAGCAAPEPNDFGPVLPRPPVGRGFDGPRPTPEPRSVWTYESGPVRPLALARDGARLYAVNTPAARLEIRAPETLELIATVPVGLEPVAVAEAGDGRVWVVNHLSDSVSIVDVDAAPPRVVRTLWVGDEPRDIVFAGEDRTRAFITAAHRGPNSPVDPALTTPGIGRADVWVFDGEDLGADAGGRPLSILTLFGDRPRALAASADGTRVYASIFLSGNGTTSLGPPMPKSEPTRNVEGVRAPEAGAVVRFDGTHWRDDVGRTFDGAVPFSLPDWDLFELDAMADPPTELRRYAGIGTVNFGVAVNPVSGALYVSNTEARNHVRFAGRSTDGRSTVRGRVADHRITVVSKDGEVRPHDLNPHLDFSRPDGFAEERARSLSTPLALSVQADGARLFVTAFGSSKLAVLDTARLEAGDAAAVITQVELQGGGPSGVVLDEARELAYVATRFDNGISVVELSRLQEAAHVLRFNPEPREVVEGRPFLYDARETSGRGTDSCATCHVFGDTDGLAWDLGDPSAERTGIPNPFTELSSPATPYAFHPMKGPMTTQSMRGLSGHGPMHWRGDRTGVDRAVGETLEEAAFKEFNEAFDSLMGREGELDDAEMHAFTDFAMTIVYPPNPLRRLDDRDDELQAAGRALFESGVVRVQTGQLEICVGCHRLDPARGIFGTSGLMSDNGQTGERNFKIPHFRDQYQKVGMFGWGFMGPTARGPQVRGFGYNHNGATSTNYVLADLGMPAADLAALRAFLFAFPTESPPAVGQQVSLGPTSESDAVARLDLLVERATVAEPVVECELYAKGVVDGEPRGWLLERGRFTSDRAAEPAWSRDAVEALSQRGEVTFTCAPWGAGRRLGIDHDLDGTLDGDDD